MSSRYDDIMATKNYLPFRMGYLTDSMMQQAQDELNETDETKEKALVEFRRLITKNTTLNCWTDDAYLLQWLRARKFNVPKAYELLNNLYTVKKAYSEIYNREVNMDLVRRVLTSGAVACLNYRQEQGCAILIIRLANWNPDQFSLQEGLLALSAVLLYCVEDPATQVCGVHILVDVKGASLRQIRTITPRYIQLFAKGLRNTVAVRFKGIHIFNESFIFTYLYNILKIFLTEKIKKRVHFHGDNAKHLHKFIPKAILPPHFGGDNVHYTESEWCKREMENYYEKFTDLLTRGY